MKEYCPGCDGHECDEGCQYPSTLFQEKKNRAETKAANDFLVAESEKILKFTGPPANCTCHPDDNPPNPCPQRHAYSECVEAAENADERPAMSHESLMHCPFCGGQAEILSRKFAVIGERYGVACTQCDCWCDYREETERAATIAWNTRFRLRPAIAH